METNGFKWLEPVIRVLHRDLNFPHTVQRLPTKWSLALKMMRFTWFIFNAKMCGTPLFNWGTQQTCRIYIIMFSELQNEVDSLPDNQFYSKTVVEGGVMTFVL